MLSPGPYQGGQNVTATFTFKNAGRAQPLLISSQTPTNLRVTGYGGDCPSIPCPATRLYPGRPFTVIVYAVVAQPAPGVPEALDETLYFRIGKTAERATAPGMLEPPPPPSIPWPAIVAGVLAVGAAGGFGAYHLWRQWWLNHVVVAVEPIVAPAAAQAGDIPIEATVRVDVRLEPGPAAPDSPVPFMRFTRNG